ncbi:SDR family NAD(P)-dependent oxidoreductase [Hyphomicrobiaceae bacterium 22]|uniref:SDR family NAD(P)-dependent oxidoreductase n=2 Tax=Prosthecodimorpha staleyi TaxID=2840188 RepID=A0A947GAQ6_9HYPH|nr:SDR family NAD(P)-dependent oxidoreductase [Prosthecodimorpha staleyi]
MTMAKITRPKRKNPILRSRVPTLPPDRRSRTALGLVRAAALGRFELQHCLECGAVQYPPRDACAACLSDRLEWRETDPNGDLLADTVVHHSQELYFRERAPWRTGLVRLDAGATVVVHLPDDAPRAPARVTLSAMLDRAGQAVLVARAGGTGTPADDPKLRELTADPRFRKCLVTDAKSPVGQAVVKALVEAGADIVWAGQCEPWKDPPGWAATRALPGVTEVPLDVTDSRSVDELAGEIGFKVDIVVNTAGYHRIHSLFGRAGVETAQAEMEVNAFGLLRLAKAFGPVMRARGADGQSSAVAWVNLLSIYAIANFPEEATYSASMAAGLSYAQALRAELRRGGVRVVNVFPGPIDDEWNQQILPPKLAPAAVANAILGALRGSVEDVYPGDVAQEWLARLRDNPKALERELGR